LSENEAVAQHSREAADFAAGYAAMGKDPYASCFAYSRRRLDLLLARHLPARGDGLRLLDLGCGTGHHLAGLRARGFGAVGIDGSGAMLREARGLDPGAPLAQSDGARVPFASGTFDYVLSVEVLRYLPDVAPTLAEAARVLKPGGTLLATAVPWLSLNGYPIVNRLLRRGLSSSGYSPLRQYFTTVGRLRRDLAAAGFASGDVHAVYWGPLNWVERLTPSLLPRFLRRWERVDAAACPTGIARATANMVLAVARKASP
jgi:SAM-dependent methyltransferase